MLVLGALTSVTIALVAIGFSLIYGVGGLVNLAHGSFFMIAAYATFSAADNGAPLLLAAFFGVAMAALGGVIMFAIVYPIRHQDVAVLIATLSIAILTQQLVRNFYGGQEKQLPAFANGSTEILGVTVLQSRLFAGVAAAVVLALAVLILVKTPAGRVARAVTEDEEAARLIGVRPELVTLIVIASGAGLAGLAGVLTAPYGVVSPLMWVLPLTQAFAIVILGGLGSIYGTLLASLIIGYLDRFVAFNIVDGEIYVGLVTIVVILATLVLRPAGLLGDKVAA